MDFKAGDRIEVVQKSDSTEDWWTGKLNGRQGVFPGEWYPISVDTMLWLSNTIQFSSGNYVQTT